jgi:hypothetical protein
MTATHGRALPLVAGLLVTLAAGTLRADALPSLDAPDLAQGPYAAGHMLFQKTILKINVATIDVRFGKAAQGKFAELVHGQAYSPALEWQIAPVAINADRAVVQMRFLRDIPLGRWIGVVRDNLEQAREANLISKELEQRVSQGLPQWFSALDKRGYEKGDRLVYSVTPDGLHTVVVSAGGQVLVDITEKDQGGRRVVLASYFAPKSDFREPLLKSLVEGNH